MYLALKNRSGKSPACMVLLGPPSLLRWANFRKTRIGLQLNKSEFLRTTAHPCPLGSDVVHVEKAPADL